MSILIKGMKMPKSCVDCPMFDWDLEYLKCKANDEFFIAKGEWRTKRESTCPLIEIPPHGRLIDADVFDERIRQAGGMYGILTTLEMLKTQQTIIEAEVEE